LPALCKLSLIASGSCCVSQEAISVVAKWPPTIVICDVSILQSLSKRTPVIAATIPGASSPIAMIAK